MDAMKIVQRKEKEIFFLPLLLTKEKKAYIIMSGSIFAEIAQLVEQWIEDPRVTSSNLVLGILV